MVAERPKEAVRRASPFRTGAGDPPGTWTARFERDPSGPSRAGDEPVDRHIGLRGIAHVDSTISKGDFETFGQQVNGIGGTEPHLGDIKPL